MEGRGTPDFLLLLMTFILVGFGIVMVYSASSAIAAQNYNDPFLLTKRQLIAAAVGAVMMIILMNIRFTIWKKGYIPFFLIILGLMIAVLAIPSEGKPRSWIDFGFLTLQPVEFAKLATILYISSYIHRKGQQFQSFTRGLLPVSLIVALMTALIMMQPDFGSTVVFLLCCFILIIAGGANLLQIFAGLMATVSLSAILIGGALMLDLGDDREYQLKRFNCFIDPWHDTQGWCWQHVQAEIALGHGGISGAGFGQSIQKLFYLPEAHNDFIFAIIGEEFGFIGVSLFILFLLLFIWRGIIVSLRCIDPYGTLLGIGIVGMFGIQSFVNIGGVTNIIPMTGITLPFISSGGSSLLVSMMSMGILLSISRNANYSSQSTKDNS
jgi:cell division protein FtsW